MAYISIAEKLAESDNRPSGFDYLRFGLAIAIMVWHSFYVCYGEDYALKARAGTLSPLINFLVPSFFALSGFLVTGSLIRVQKISVFLALRFLRIVPALAVEVIISALLIGPLVTILPLKEYFSSTDFFSYFLNIIGEIHFYLPGVFTENPVKTTNQQLWTIPYELLSYVCLTLLAVVGLVARPAFLAITTVFFTLWCYNQDIHNHGALVVVCCFLWGSVFYLFKEKIPLNAPLFVLMTLLEITVMRMDIPYIGYLLTIPITYMTIYLGAFNPPRKFPITTGDYSYGLYLYSMAIQQALYLLFPACREWYGNLAISFPVTFFFAWLSWNFVELKILNYKNKVLSFVYTFTGKILALQKSLKT